MLAPNESCLSISMISFSSPTLTLSLAIRLVWGSRTLVPCAACRGFKNAYEVGLAFPLEKVQASMLDTRLSKQPASMAGLVREAIWDWPAST